MILTSNFINHWSMRTNTHFINIIFYVFRNKRPDKYFPDKIKIINDDANEVFLSLKYDVIFIDAAKAKNQIFFDKFSNNLNENGIIIIDNMNLIDFQKHVSPKKASFYLNINKNLKRYLNSLTNYSVTYLDVGDGIALIKKK